MAALRKLSEARRGSAVNPEDLPASMHRNVLRLDDGLAHRVSIASPQMVGTVQGATAATHAEHKMTLLQGLKTYPKAMAWSILLSTCIIMEGYDVVLINSFFAFPAFNYQFGYLQSDGRYGLSAAWQTGLANGAQVGEILGLMMAGWIAERYGYRTTILGALFLMICFIFPAFFAKNVQTLLAAEILCGLPWGAFQTLTTTYAAEVTPVALRAYLTTYVNLCWVIGQFIASGVLRSQIRRPDTDQWAWRLPIALQWMWPLPLMIGVFFAPESPWWLVRRERLQDAKHSLSRLTSKDRMANFDLDDTIAMMVHTNELEKQINSGTRYIDCFKGVDLRRTEVACGAWAIQNLCGTSFMGASTYFYRQAGLSINNAFSLTLGQYAIGMVGTIGSWFLMVWFGRRTLYIAGLVIMSALLFIIGFVAIAPDYNTGAQWAIGSMLLIFIFTYDITVGPVCYSLVAELPSARLKVKTVVLARNFYNIIGIITNILNPRMLNPDAWNWKGKAGFFWAGSCALCSIWTFFRLPEPKGRTYGELDVLFEKKISARKFKDTIVDPFHGESDVDQIIVEQEKMEKV